MCSLSVACSFHSIGCECQLRALAAARRFVADSDGLCVCAGGNVAIEDSCVPAFVVAGVVAVPVATALALAYAIWMQKRVLALDAAWRVALCDLSFDEPVVVLGRGAFGAVLRARVRHGSHGSDSCAGWTLGVRERVLLCLLDVCWLGVHETLVPIRLMQRRL